MSIQEKLSYTIEKVDNLYSSIFGYICDIDSDAKYTMVRDMCFELNKLDLALLVSEAGYNTTVDKNHLIKNLIVIFNKHNDAFQKYQDYEKKVLRLQKHDNFIYKFIEGHFEELGSTIKKLEKTNSISKGNKSKPKKKELNISITESQLENLHNSLLANYISHKTTLNDFKQIFDINNWENDSKIKQISWVLTNPKNNDASIKGLVDLFLLLQDNQFVNFNSDQTLYKFLNKHFIDKDSHPIKSSSANKPQWVKGKFASEHDNFIKIIDSL